MSAKKLFSTVSLSELKKRVPKNQLKQFEEFSNICAAYQREVDKYPDKLPFIDWDFYRSNVRKNFVNMVHQFEVQYIELDKAFEARNDLDLSKYYQEWNKVMEDCKKDVEAFKKESNERINELQAELKRLSEMKPYEEMTMEEYVILREDITQLIPCQNRPIFWPPIEEEQAGYIHPNQHDDHDDEESKPTGDKKDDKNKLADAAKQELKKLEANQVKEATKQDKKVTEKKEQKPADPSDANNAPKDSDNK